MMFMNISRQRLGENVRGVVNSRDMFESNEAVVEVFMDGTRVCFERCCMLGALESSTALLLSQKRVTGRVSGWSIC